MSGTDILSMVIVGLASTLVYGSISLYLANDLLQSLVAYVQGPLGIPKSFF